MNKISGKILVAGADGFIGSHLVEALIREGCNVRALVFYNSFNSEQFVLSVLNPLSETLDSLGCVIDISKIKFHKDSSIKLDNPNIEDLYV